MATNKFTKEAGAEAKEVLKEMFDGFSRNKQLEYLGHMNDVALFIEAAIRNAPLESESSKATLNA